MPKVKVKVKKDNHIDRMSAWIRVHSGHTILIKHKAISGNVDGEFERFMCHCESCGRDELFYYIAETVKPREKKLSCEECKV
jgi:hypothetical protein